MRPTIESIAIRPVLWLGCALAGWFGACSPDATPAAEADAIDVVGDGASGKDGVDAKPEIVVPKIEVKIEADHVAGNAPLQVKFKGSFTGINATDALVQWDFGGFGTSDLLEPEHKFLVVGKYNVTLTVTKAGTKYKGYAATEIMVSEPADVGVTTLYVTPTTVAQGDEVTATFNVLNGAAAIVAPFDVAIYLSKDETLSAGDVVAATKTIDSMAAAQGTKATELTFADPSKEHPDAKPFKFFVPKDTPDGLYFVFVKVDQDDVIAELNKADNVSMATSLLTVDHQLNLKPDLTVVAPTIKNATSVSLGEQVKYNFAVANVGEKVAKNFLYQVVASADPYIDESDVPVTEDGNSKLFTLDFGKSQSVDRSFALVGARALADGEYWLIARVDPKNVVTEVNESNNVAVSKNTFTVKKVEKIGPDIVLSDAVFKPKGTYLEGSVSIEFKLTNAGNVASPPVSVGLYFSQDTQLSKTVDVFNQKNVTVTSIQAGETKDVSQIVKVTKDTPLGDWYVFVQVDPEGKIAELDETNNLAMIGKDKPLKITGSAKVDVAADAVGVHPEPVKAGEIGKLSYTITNLGISGSGAFVNYFVLSADPYVSIADVQSGKDLLLKKANNSGVEGLETKPAVESVLLPLALDHAVTQYYVGVILDAETSIPNDSNKANNVAVSPQPITILQPKGGCYEDAWESNNKASDAKPLKLGITKDLGSCGNEDWWRIAVVQGHSITVTLDSTSPLWLTPRPFDLDLDLYDPSGKQIIDSVKGLGTQKTIVGFALPASGDYLLRVYGHSSLAQAHYSLTVQDQAPSPGVDLMPTHLKVLPDSTFPGSVVNVSFDLTNLGATPATAFSAKLMMSADTVIEATDTLVKELSFAKGLEGATTTKSKQNVLLPSVEGGTYYMGVILDANGALSETNEDNNTGVSNVLLLSGQYACKTDPFTPNHTIDDAKVLDPSTAIFAGLNVCPGLEDWFSVELPQGKALTADIGYTHVAGKGLVGVQILDPSKTAIIAGSSDPKKTSASVPYVQIAGTYYVHVYALPEIGDPIPYDYTLALTVADPNAGDVCLPDFFELNNDPSAAKTIGCGASILTLCKTDVDWFALPLKTGDPLVATLTHPDKALQMALYGDINQPPLKSILGNGTFNFTAVEDTTYLLRVQPKPGMTLKTYDYTIDLDGVGGIDLTATVASVYPEQVYQGEDVLITFSITNQCKDPSPPFEYTVFLSQDTILDPTDVSLTNAPVQEGLDGKQTVELKHKVIVPFATAPGPYYLLLQPDATNVVAETHEENNTGAIALQVLKLCIEDLYEPNATAAEAGKLTPGDYPNLVLCPNDLDWFKVDLEAGKAVTIALTFDQAMGDLDVRLYAPANPTVPVAASTTQAAPETIVWMVPETGTYYLRINGFAGASNAYDLSIVQ